MSQDDWVREALQECKELLEALPAIVPTHIELIVQAMETREKIEKALDGNLPACKVNPISSAMCNQGTKGCEIQYEIEAEFPLVTWYPIETAPCDDDLYLLWDGKYGQPQVVDLDHDSDPQYWEDRGFTHWARISPPKDCL